MIGMVSKMAKKKKTNVKEKKNEVKKEIKKIDKKEVKKETVIEKKSCKKELIFYSLVFITTAVLCYLFPFTHDDWAWGSGFGIERLMTNFDNYNGRWFGNFTVLLLTRSNVLKTISMALCLTLLLWFINKLTKDNKLNKWISLFLLAAIPKFILRQGLVWTSGFANYVVSIVLVLIYIYMNRKLFEDKYEEVGKLKSILLFILGFITALFVEHVTIYLLVLGIFVIGYKYIKFKKISFSSIMYFIGSVLGTILMFSNSAYSNVASGNDGYRSFGLSNFIGSSIKSFFNTISNELFLQNYVLNIVLSVCILIFLYKYLINNPNSKFKKLIYLMVLVLVAFPIYALILKVTTVPLFLKYTKYVSGLFSIIYFLCIFASTLFISDKAKMKRIIFVLFSILMLTAPLFVVTPIGSRCFFPMYILWIWVCVEYFDLVIVNKENEFIKVILIGGIITFYVYLLLTYAYIFKVNLQRENYIKDNLDKDYLVLPKLPYESYHWLGNPLNEEFETRFRSFYGINEDTELEFISLKEWKKVK